MTAPLEQIRPVWHGGAEASVLGAMIVAPGVLDDTDLPADAFFDPRHRRAYSVLLDLRARGVLIDEKTVAIELERVAGMDAREAHLLVAELVHEADVPHAAPAHARLVAEDYTRRLIQTETAAIAADSQTAPLDELRARLDLARTIATDATASAGNRLVSGGAFILDAATDVEAVWGRGDEVLWSAGETLMIVGPQGVGKTTLAQQLTLARCGLRDDLLDFPIRPDDRRVLYIAADRPRQAQRSFVRMVTEAERVVLDERLVVWEGPPEFDIAVHPERLTTFATDIGAGTVVIDSLKDVALDLVKDETGSRVNAALQRLLAAGIEVVVLHHQRKAQQGGGKPKALADVYGSTWLTTGVGSIVLLWGEAGDPVVELEHKKQPAAAVGPFKLLHDHVTGVTTIYESGDPLVLLRATSRGLTATDAACALFATSSPSRNEIEKARRKLDAAVRRGVAVRRDEMLPDGRGGTPPARYFAAALGEAP